MRLFAYLDPGSASALLAAVLAGVAGIGAALRTYGKNFLNTLMFWKKSEPDDGQSGAGDEAGNDEATDDEATDDAEAPDATASDPVGSAANPSEADGSSGQ